MKEQEETESGGSPQPHPSRYAEQGSPREGETAKEVWGALAIPLLKAMECTDAHLATLERSSNGKVKLMLYQRQASAAANGLKIEEVEPLIEEAWGLTPEEPEPSERSA